MADTPSDDRAAEPTPLSSLTRWLRDDRRRRIVTLLLLAAAVVLAITGTADDAAVARADALFQRALVTFASARALDAVISAAQGTELALEPAGVGVTFSAGEVLDPLNDLVEQFATIVLLAATSLGIQSLVLRIASWWGLTLLLGLAAGAWAWTAWRGEAARPAGRRLRRVVVMLLVVRFGLAAVTLTSGWIFDTFLEPEQRASLAVLEQTRDEVGTLAEVGEAPDADDPRARASWTERLRAWWDDPLPGNGVQDRLEAFRDGVNAAVESIVRLIVIFVLQTLVIPLLLLWAGIRLVGARLG